MAFPTRAVVEDGGFAAAERRLLELPGVSPFGERTERAFRESFSNAGSVAYGNAWEYVVQGTFFGAYQCEEGETRAAISTWRPRELPWVVVKTVGKDAVFKTAALARELVRISSLPVIVKNLNENDFRALGGLGFGGYRAGDAWSPFFPLDDDTFPEVVVDLKSLAGLAGRDYRTLRFWLHKFARQNGRVRLEPYRARQHYGEASRLLSRWAESLSRRFAAQIRQDPLLLHSVGLHDKFLSTPPSARLGKDYFANVLWAGGEPVGFALAAKISDSAVGVYSTVTDASVPGSAETVTFETLKQAFDAGYRFANLGGSEFASLHQFKLKFAPCQQLQRRHAVLYPNSTPNGEAT